MDLQNFPAKRPWKAFKTIASWQFVIKVTTFIALFQPLQGSSLQSLGGPDDVYCPAHCTCEYDSPHVGRAVVCSNPDTLTSVPQMVIDDALTVTTLNIVKQPRLTQLPNGTFRNFTHLTRLIIKESGLKQLDDHVFDGLKLLHDLDISNNSIVEYPTALMGFSNVTEISLQGNPFCQCVNTWALNVSAVSNVTHIPCMSGHLEKTEGLANFTNSLLKQCTLIELPPINSAIVVSSGDNIILTCPLKVMDITWDMTNIKSQWQLRTTKRQVEILNMLEADMFRAVTCRGANSTHTVQAKTFLVKPCEPTIMSMFFHGTSFRVRLHLTIVGWPLPTVHWEVDDIAGEEQNTSLSDLDSQGMIDIDLHVQPAPRKDVFVKAVVTNSLGSDIKQKKLITGQSTMHEPSQLIGVESDISFNGTLEPAGIPTIVVGSEKTQLLKIVLGTVGVILCVAVVLALCLIKYRDSIKCFKPWKHLKGQPLGSYNLAARMDDLSLHGMVDNPMYNGMGSTTLLSCPPTYTPKFKGVKKIALEKISMMRLIGEGNFGLVFLGECANLEKKKSSTTVAIKTLKGDSSEALRRDFEREAELLTTFKHENIVHLYGVCTERDNWMLVFEYMEHGDLHKYLRSRAPDTVRKRGVDEPEMEALSGPELVLIIKQIAKGLQFLTAQHFVHRDLATRNCLVGKDLQVKIGDFGLARDIYITDYYRVGNPTMLPYRWLALESIRYGKFTTKSDVWSFGVMMWEVFTYGQKPWCELSIPEMVAQIESGDRLPCPQGCPDEIYHLMLEGCWKLDESERYDMTKICDILYGIDLKEPEYLDIVA